MNDSKRDIEVEDAVLVLDKEHNEEAEAKKYLTGVIDGNEVKISFTNMEASDALEVIAGIIIKVSESTGVSPSHIQKDIKSFVKSAMKDYVEEKDGE